MLSGLATRLIAGTVALGIVGGVGWWFKGLLDDRAALVVERAANKSNQAVIDRLEADQVIAQAIAIADAQERQKLETERDELVDAAKGAGPCNALDRIIERRRLQRHGTGGPSP